MSTSTAAFGSPALEVEEPLQLRRGSGRPTRAPCRPLERPLGGVARVADQAGAAAEQRDRRVAGALEPREAEQRHEVADLQRGRRRVEAAVDARRRLAHEPRADPLLVGGLEELAPPPQVVDDRVGPHPRQDRGGDPPRRGTIRGSSGAPDAPFPWVDADADTSSRSASTFAPPPAPRPVRHAGAGSGGCGSGSSSSLLTLLAIVSSLFGFMTAVAQNAPNLDQFTAREPAQVGFLYARDPKKPQCRDARAGAKGCWIRIGSLRQGEARQVLKADQISRPMQDAIVAIEDQRFYQHKGFDPEGIVRAVFNRVALGRREGGSTITQQLIKNTYLTSEQTVRRKFQEIMLAYQLERAVHSKPKILASYLNTIYFGHGCLRRRRGGPVLLRQARERARRPGGGAAGGDPEVADRVRSDRPPAGGP